MDGTKTRERDRKREWEGERKSCNSVLKNYDYVAHRCDYVTVIISIPLSYPPGASFPFPRLSALFFPVSVFLPPIVWLYLTFPIELSLWCMADSWFSRISLPIFNKIQDDGLYISFIYEKLTHTQIIPLSFPFRSFDCCFSPSFWFTLCIAPMSGSTVRVFYYLKLISGIWISLRVGWISSVVFYVLYFLLIWIQKIHCQSKWIYLWMDADETKTTTITIWTNAKQLKVCSCILSFWFFSV